MWFIDLFFKNVIFSFVFCFFVKVKTKVKRFYVLVFSFLHQTFVCLLMEENKAKITWLFKTQKKTAYPITWTYLSLRCVFLKLWLSNFLKFCDTYVHYFCLNSIFIEPNFFSKIWFKVINMSFIFTSVILHWYKQFIFAEFVPKTHVFFLILNFLSFCFCVNLWTDSFWS